MSKKAISCEMAFFVSNEIDKKSEIVIYQNFNNFGIMDKIDAIN